MEQPKPYMTRREFIKRVAGAGGSAYAAMVALELLPVPAARAFSLAGQVQDKRVVILGAGLAGMCAAYELGKLGYTCQLLEARSRPGGRCWTVRRGTVETESDGQRQTADFDEDLYFNPGPARIPHHHHTVLGYCREFGVAVETFTNVNEGAYYYTEGRSPLDNQRVRIRQAKADMRGYVAELLAKAVRQDLLDQPLSGTDREKLLQFLDQEGALAVDHSYRGSARRGYSTLPSAGPEPGTVAAPDELSALLQAGWGNFFNLEYEFDQQMTMLQIVDGTDRLAQAFAARLEGKIQYEAEVQEIRQMPEGARIIYQAAGSGQPEVIEADFCICTLPLTVLRKIPADFSQAMQEAIRMVYYLPAGKIGLQFSRRFWEEDEGIFGGISRTNMEISQIWYPSSGYLSPKGILVGYYNFDNQAFRLGQLSPAEREAEALAQGRKIHPQYDDTFERSFSVSWHKLPYTLGGFAFYTDFTRESYYPRINEPQGAIYLAGEHASYLTGWMAGALESAQRVVGLIHERVLRDKN